LADLARPSPRLDIRQIATGMQGTRVDDATQIHGVLWPGGGIMGASGRLAALEVLRDLGGGGRA
jgi:hypothetical protein